ncbi:unnamed protein product [Paramecium sonneborni]|uniref:Cathepsin propeptide inhibitor domain-containing protein n=1 Tax=Paramecium sonneborni TaxID=65129 RepID=A0A8S1JWY3_9CILI|nr:unnamed protein product [Paramecium sonneborni]
MKRKNLHWDLSIPNIEQWLTQKSAFCLGLKQLPQQAKRSKYEFQLYNTSSHWFIDVNRNTLKCSIAQFTNYQATYNKQYQQSELLYRLQVYEANLALLEEKSLEKHNSQILQMKNLQLHTQFIKFFQKIWKYRKRI